MSSNNQILNLLASSQNPALVLAALSLSNGGTSSGDVEAAIAALKDSAPAALDTLNELAAALGDDANFAATVATALGLKAPAASPTFTGTTTWATGTGFTYADATASGAHRTALGFGVGDTPTLNGLAVTADANIGGALNANGAMRVSTAISFGSNSDAWIIREGPNVLSLRNAANPQELQVYGTYSSGGTNHERMRIFAQASGNYRFWSEAAGTGTVRNWEFGTGSTAMVTINASGLCGILLPASTLLSFNDPTAGIYGGGAGASSSVSVRAGFGFEIQGNAGAHGGPLRFIGRAIVTPTADGVLRITNTAGTGFGYLDLVNLTVGASGTGTQAAVGITNAHAGQTHSWVHIEPMGNGGFYIGPRADGLTSGGNARGTNAIDMQMARSAASQVVSGHSAFGAGRYNTVTGQTAWSLGEANSVSGSYAGCLGRFSAATATDAFTIGASCTANATGGLALGLNSIANRLGQVSRAYGIFAGNGDCQRIELIARRATASTAQVELTLDGNAPNLTVVTTSNRIIIEANTTVTMEIRISGRVTGGGGSFSAWRRVAIERDGSNNTALVGSVETIGTDVDTTGGTTVLIQADDTNESLQILITPGTSSAMRTAADIHAFVIGHA